jgi:hypothetical protein
MVGWLFFSGALVDADFETVIREHEEVNRPLSKQFEAMYREGLQYRLMERKSA